MRKVDPASFEERYRLDDDPWAFATSRYELGKYATTICALAKAGYDRCFEPACSIGVLTERLAARCHTVVACDVSALAIERARARLARSKSACNVELHVESIPDWWPQGNFDLIVLSELGYYWDIAGWGDVIECSRRSLVESGEIVAVHWLGHSGDHLLGGYDVHAELERRLGPADLHIEAGADSKQGGGGFVLDRWSQVTRA